MIEEHFEKVKAFKDRIVKQNKEIMSAIDVFTIGTKLENRKVFKEHFKKLSVNHSGKIELEEAEDIKNCDE